MCIACLSTLKMQFKATSVRTARGTLLGHVQYYGFSFLSAMATDLLELAHGKIQTVTLKSLLLCESLNLYQISGPQWLWKTCEQSMCRGGVNKGKRHKQQDGGEEVTGTFHEDIN